MQRSCGEHLGREEVEVRPVLAVEAAMAAHEIGEAVVAAFSEKGFTEPHVFVVTPSASARRDD